MINELFFAQSFGRLIFPILLTSNMLLFFVTDIEFKAKSDH